MNCKGNPLTSRYFMLNAAVATSDSRLMLQHVYCDGENFVATNGKILVWTANMENLPKGFYDVGEAGCGRNKTLKFVPFTGSDAGKWTYPNYKQVIPNCTSGKEMEFHGGKINLEQEIFNLQFTLASFGTGALIAQEFIDLICKPELDYTVRIIDGLNPVIFECKNFFSFVVMPRRDRGESSTAKLIAQFKDDAVREWKATRDAYEGRPRIDPVEAETMPPKVTAPETETQAAAEPEQPETETVAEPAPEEPQDAPETATEPEAAPEAAPEADTPQDATATPKAKPRRKRKPAFAYVCELESGERITLGSIAEVEARGDVVKCNIEPVKKHRAA